MAPFDEAWAHIETFLLKDYALNTLWLLGGCGVMALILGVTCAALTTFCQFPGRVLFEWLFAFPLVFPLYVLSFIYVGLFEYSGPVLTYFREEWHTSLGGPSFNIKSPLGVCVIFSLGLYPYVYLIAKRAFSSVGGKAMAAARSLGASPLRAFFKVVLPLSRPWILSALLLVMMEALSDFGGVSVFNYSTLTTAIYTAWFGLFSLEAASKIALISAAVAFGLVAFERHFKENSSHYASLHSSSLASPPPTPLSLPLWGQALALAFSLGVVVASTLLPMAQLIGWAWGGGGWSSGGGATAHLPFLLHSLSFALLGSLFIVGVALLFAVVKRCGYQWEGLMNFLLSLLLLGYALPGPLIALSVFMSYKSLGGSLAILLLGYGIRFLSVGYLPIDRTYGRISKNMDKAAHSLGKGPFKIFKGIHLPLIRRSVLISFLLVFVELLKEMPLTLFIRPFGRDTLAIKVFEWTSEGEWERAAVPSLFIAMAGFIPLFFLILEKRQR